MKFIGCQGSRTGGGFPLRLLMSHAMLRAIVRIVCMPSVSAPHSPSARPKAMFQYCDVTSGQLSISNGMFIAWNAAVERMAGQLSALGNPVLAARAADLRDVGRRVLAQIDPALKLLRENGYIAKVNNVICAEVADRPMGLSEVLAVIDEAGLSVEYMYSFLRGSEAGKAHMILRLSDGQKALKVFELKGIHVLEQDEVDKM